MVKAKVILFINTCLLCFYITALIKDSGASDVSCVNIIWYLAVLITSLEVVFALNRAGAVAILGNHEISLETSYFWHKSKIIAAFFVICWVAATISNGMLFYYVISIPPSCKKKMRAYWMFWKTAELQSVIYIIEWGFLLIASIFLLIVLAIYAIFNPHFREVLSSDVEDPVTVPVNHGTEMAANKCRKPSVTKTDEEEKACSVCQENEKTHACIPCGHMCLCALCAEELSKRSLKDDKNRRCPICRVEVDNFSRIYQ